jgi:hypothetical protein
MAEQRANTVCGMIIVFGALAILILWGSFVGFLAVSRDAQLAAAERTSAALALALEQHAETVFAAADSALTTIIAEMSELGGRGPHETQKMHAVLARNIANHRYLVGLVVVDEAGRLRYDPRFDGPSQFDVADRDYFIAQRDRADLGLFIGAPVESRVTGQLVIPMSRRLQDADGKFAGIVVATVPIAKFEEFLRTLQLAPQSVAGIVRHDGLVLVRQPPADVIGTSLANNRIFREYIPRSRLATVRVVSDIDGIERINSYRALTTMAVVSYNAISIEDALADWHRSVRLMSAIGLFCSATIALLTALLVRQAKRRETAERQHRHSEAQLEDARKLEAVGQLAGGIAHDFNNILGAILGFAGFLVQDLESGTPQRRFAERIATAGQRG